MLHIWLGKDSVWQFQVVSQFATPVIDKEIILFALELLPNIRLVNFLLKHRNFF